MSDDRATPPVDVVLAGPVFFDLILSGLDAQPEAGTEVYARTMGSTPGGIANLAVAASRLGLRASLASVFGDDDYGRWCWDVLSAQEGVDLSRSARVEGLQTAVTVAIADGGDRKMVTHGPDVTAAANDLLVDGIDARAALVDLKSMSDDGTETAWWKRAAAHGTRVFADIGWDSTGAWDPRDLDPLDSCFAFSPNEREAMAYTRTDSPIAAARRLAERVPLVVVTCGADGAIAIDSATGDEAQVTAVPVELVDATGAGDVFAAAFTKGTLDEWPLGQRIAFASLCSALAVQQLGGSLGSPGWAEIADWWEQTRSRGDSDLVSRYGFLTDLLPTQPAAPARRAEATFRLPLVP